MGKEKLNYVDKGINTLLLLIITIVIGLITVVALATNYIIGVFCTVVLMVFVNSLLKDVDLEKFVDEYIKGRKW